MKHIYLRWSFFSLLFILGINSTIAQSATADSINSITDTTAQVYWNITDKNNTSIKGGLCYGTSPLPTINDSIGSVHDTGTFNTKISGLILNTTYYVRIYLTNTVTTTYSNQLQFTTKNITLPIVTTDSINNITATTAYLYGTISNNGNDTSVYGGFCYSTIPNPTIADNIIGVYNDTGSFTYTLYHLIPDTVYFVRAYATNAEGTSYGSQRQFKTGFASSPIVTTDSINNITATTAFGFGTVTNDGNDPTAINGFCFSTSPNPTIADDTVESIYYGSKPFYVIFGIQSQYPLNPTTTYYVRAFSTNVVGTSYGSQRQFTTGAATLPTVITDFISTITDTSASGHGHVTNNGNDPTVIGGFCLSTSPNPTIANDTVGYFHNDTIPFTSVISSLSPNNTYYVRAYATNAAGTAYGNQLQFITLIAGIEQISSLKIELSLSPNPTNGLLTINFVSEEGCQLEIDLLNALGVNLNLSKTLTAIRENNSATLDLSTITNGVYFVQIKTNGVVVATQKIIKTE